MSGLPLSMAPSSLARSAALSAMLTRPAARTAAASTSLAMRDASPQNFVKPGLPPFLLVHGTGDQTVAFQQSVEMQTRLRAVGVPCELLAIKDGPHGMLPWPKLAPDFAERVVAWTSAPSAVKPRESSPVAARGSVRASPHLRLLCFPWIDVCVDRSPKGALFESPGQRPGNRMQKNSSP